MVSKDFKILYILGVQRSGSTVIDMCLGMAPEVVSLGELQMIDEYVCNDSRQCTCGSPLMNCKFWTPVLSSLGWRSNMHRAEIETMMRMERYGGVRRYLRCLVSLLLGKRSIAFSRYFDGKYYRLALRNLKLLYAIHEVHQSSVYIDSSKNGLRLMMLRALFPGKVRVLMVQRDGRAVVNSLMRHYNMEIGTASQQWKCSQESLLWIKKLLPGKDIFNLSYEEFCYESSLNLSRIYEWLGVSVVGGKSSSGYVNRVGRHNIHGSPSRYDGALAAVKLDERWRGDLSKNELRKFDEVAGSLNKKLGYVGM